MHVSESFENKYLLRLKRIALIFDAIDKLSDGLWNEIRKVNKQCKYLTIFERSSIGNMRHL